MNTAPSFAQIVPIEAPPAEVSEDAIAIAFRNTYAATLRFDHDEGRWFEWDGTRWRQDRCDRAFHYAREIGRRMGQGKRQMCRAGVAGGAERFARADPALAVTSDHWDADPFLLGTPGGVVNLRTGELLPPDPELRITKTTEVAPEPGEPSLWLSFLNDATGGDQELIDFLQRWTGYCLTGDTREHALLFVYGGGGNGKSVFINTLTKLLGEYTKTATMETFTAARGERHSTDVAMLKGSRLVTASETEEGRAWAEARIKQMTGGDPITARFMRRDNFTFLPQFKLTIVGNHAPVLHNVDEAMRRRFRIMPFNRKPARPDRLLEEKLTKEWPRILQWMIDGCMRWQDSGLNYPEAMVAATNDYFESQDVFGQWLADKCSVGPKEWEHTSKLFESWCAYARGNGEEAGSSKKFSSTLTKRGFFAGRASTVERTRLFKGLSLKRVANFDEDQGYPR